MEYLLIAGVFQCVLLAMLMFTKKDRALSDLLLGSYFLLNAINFLLSFIEAWNFKHDFPYPFFILTASPPLLLHGPALWFYIKSLTSQKFRFRPVYLLHFLPFTYVLFEHANAYYFLPSAERILLMKSQSFTGDPKFFIILSLMLVSILFYFGWGLLMLKHYRQRIRNYYSYTDSIELNWMKVLLTSAIIVYALIHIVFGIAVFKGIAPFTILQKASFGFAALYILVLGFYGLRQGDVFSSGKPMLDLERSHIPVNQPGNRDGSFVQELLKFMKEKKPFLDPDINLAGLAQQLSVTPEYLSGILNGSLRMNFFDFINRYRVEEFKERCLNPENSKLSILGIAFDSGFNSKATFNRVFKTLTGFTPGEYKTRVSGK